MSPHSQLIALAEACDWEVCHGGKYVRISGLAGLVDPLADLVAMHEAKRALLCTRELCDRFNKFLIECKPPLAEIQFETDKWTWGQSAAVEAEALLRTTGNWEDICG